MTCFVDVEVVYDADEITLSDFVRVLRACEVCGVPWLSQDWDLESIWIGDISDDRMEELLGEIESLGIPGVRVRAGEDADDDFEEAVS